MALLEVRNATKRFGGLTAVGDLTFDMEEGSIVSVIGPNGAGKTTLLKILSCLVIPDRGRAVVGGFETSREYEVKRRIGLVNADERSFYWRLSGRENLRFFARLYDVPGGKIDPRIDELLERVEMSEAADRPFSDYSSGMKQRVAICRALLHDPPILLMDEPTRSLDPASSLALRSFILDELRGRDGKTVVLASHDLPEVEALADRVSFIVGGRVRRQGTVEAIKRWGVDERRFVLDVAAGQAGLAGPFRVVADETVEGRRRVEVLLDAEADFQALMRALLAAGVDVRSCNLVEPDLEQAFSRILEAEGESD